VTTKKSAAHRWLFPTRIRPNSFTWKSSSTAATRIKEAIAEIKTVSRNDPAAAAEGAVRLIERLSPALEHVDSSSGAIGTAVNRAIEALVPIICAANVSVAVREKWLERLYEAHADDQIPYIETLAEFWGELCVTRELASAWADRMIGITQMALSPDKSLRGHYHGTTACLSALLHAGRYDDIHSLLAHTDFWHYKCYAVKALAAEGKHDEAIALTESLRGPWTPDRAADRLCERILLESGRIEERIGASVCQHIPEERIWRPSARSRRRTRASRASRSSAISSNGRRAMREGGSPRPRNCACLIWHWSWFGTHRVIRRP
jgi:hypothetical protein